ncbi:unnamed protein product [Didymodactylos carnosus]|uniref:DUF3504 domain-containing protein n=1 Tax=Didymodactylos carnosus TaxID=1234261 RepID=A0A813P0U1_9BILA|nr:unnamed protein product [Didymodactylos carnosus]CAF0746536.1 unnamed protein product [Didymodactylos carnosus]CAF3512025.1 unnamed protein product [Didymodactylos carnosus]CAF3525389.1 unnamed protein product [Didymodactylos carnosus]
MLYKTSAIDSTLDKQTQDENDEERLTSRTTASQHYLPDIREALRSSNLPLSTLCSYINHKVTLCKPLTRTKAITCSPITFNRSTQTEADLPPIGLLPVPVGLITPLPLALGVDDTPVPVPVPIPVPFPLFFVVSDKKFQHYSEYLEKLGQRIPDNDDDSFILAYAQTLFPNDDILCLGNDNGSSDIISKSMITTSTTPLIRRDHDLNLLMDKHTGDDEDDRIQFRRPHATTTTSSITTDVATEYDVEHFDLSTSALTSNGTQNNPDLALYLMEQEDSKDILKWHLGVKAFMKWIERKNQPIRNRLYQQYTRNRRLTPAEADARIAKRLFKSDPLKYRADELNRALSLFVKEARRLSGEEYAPDSIYYLCLCIQHYLRENKPLGTSNRHEEDNHLRRTENIFFDSTFEQFQSALNLVLGNFSVRLLTPDALGVSRIEEEVLWEAKQLGSHSPWILLNTILYFNTKYFFLKTVGEHNVLSFSNVRRHYKRNIGPHGEEFGKSVYLRYYPPTTTFHGMEEQQLIYEQAENYDDPLRCPVKLFEFYLTKCPEQVKCRQDVLYLIPETTVVPDSPIWFSSTPLPHFFMDRMLTRIKTVRDVNDIHLSMSQTSFEGRL